MDYEDDLYDSVVHDDSFYDDTSEDRVHISKMRIDQIYQLCLRPTTVGFAKSVSQVFVWCIIYRFSIQLFKPAYIHHFVSFIAGLLTFHSVFYFKVHLIIVLVFISYAFLLIATYLQYEKQRGFLLTLLSLSYLSVCDLWLIDPKMWHRIRGPHMIVVMKSISLAFDLDIGTVKSIPNLINYLGYMFNPSTCVFGPWISYSDYKLQYKRSLNLAWAKKIIIKLVLACISLSVSSCWSDFLIPMESMKWFNAYRDALAFRASHYFISYLSEALLLISGFSSPTFNGVAKPLMVELPRSIVSVVVYWNIPMHNWLKVYVFNTSLKFGNFIAVLSTYAVSSLLHGLNFQLSAVLLSLGLYSYIEVMLRKKLASAFNACILAKNCKAECVHKYKKYHPLVLLANGVLLVLTLFHLTYLGFVFDTTQMQELGYTWRHTMSKWASLGFMSHYVAFLTYIMYFFIR